MTVRDLSSIFSTTIDYPHVPSASFPSRKDAEGVEVGGKTSRVPSPDAATGARLTMRMTLALREASGETLTDDERAEVKLDDVAERSFYADILGPVYDEMIADGVTWSVLRLTAQDAHLIITDNQALADITLASQGEAIARANRAQRRAVKKVAAKKTPRTAKKTAGSKSSAASGATQARTRTQGSTRSSTTPAAKKAASKAS